LSINSVENQSLLSIIYLYQRFNSIEVRVCYTLDCCKLVYWKWY